MLSTPNHLNYNFLDRARDWFKILLFSTNSLAKLLTDNLLSDSSMSQSHSQLWFKSTNHARNCSLNQPIPTLVSITIEKVNRLLHWGFLQNGEFFPLKNDSIIEDNIDFVYPMAQMTLESLALL